jgi:tRNA pseudouridine55 synthase
LVFLEVCCSKGTYIRTLVQDIGTSLGTVAVTAHINRTRQGPFTLEDALTEDQWDRPHVQVAIERSKTVIE